MSELNQEQLSKINRGATEVCKILQKAGYQAYLVGGCVRDLFLGKTPKDWDITTNSTPEDTIKLFETNNYKVIPTGIAHGTVTVFKPGDEQNEANKYEITVFRGEGKYSDGRRPDAVYFVDNVEEDLSRRDLTINAMAFDPVNNVLVDPFGGKKDIDNKVIKAVGDPNIRFSEDGLRTMRAARFVGAFGFDLDPETESAIKNNLPLLNKISSERKRDEILKTLKTKNVAKALLLFKTTGILDTILPELSNIDLNKAAEYINNFNNSFGSNESIGLFFLCLDLGANKTEKFLPKLILSNDVKEEIIQLIYTIELYKKTFISNVSRDDVRKFLSVVKNKYPRAYSSLENIKNICTILNLPNVKEVFSFDEKGIVASDLSIDGNDLKEIFNIKPGKELGQTLKYLLEQVILDPSKNNREDLILLAREFLEKNFPNTLKTQALLNKINIFEKLAIHNSILIKAAMFESLANSKWIMPEDDYNKYLNIVYNIGKTIIPISETPELHFKGVPAGPEEHHPEIYQSTHNDLVFERAKELMPNMPEGQYAALLHDVGKGVTDPNIWPRQLMHESLGGPLADTISDRLKMPESYKKIARFMAENHLRVHQVIGKDGNVASPKAIRKLIQDFKNEVIDDKDAFTIFLLACQADAQGRTGHKDKPYPQMQKLLSSWDEIKLESEKKKTEELAINANELMQELNIPPGKIVGMIVGELKKFVKENPDQNNHKEKLLEKARHLLIS